MNRIIHLNSLYIFYINLLQMHDSQIFYLVFVASLHSVNYLPCCAESCGLTKPHLFNFAFIACADRP